MKDKRIRWLLWIGLTVFGVVAAVVLLRPEPLEVDASLVECGPMQVAISSEGRTRIRDRFVISAPVDGNLARLRVKEGHRVKQGDVLGWLMPAPLDIRSERQFEAALQVAQSEHQAAEAQVARARVDLNQAARELQRLSGLVGQGVRPRQELDSAQTAEAAAREALNAATFAAKAAAIHVDEVRSALLAGDRNAIPIRATIDGVVLRVAQQSERIVDSGTPIVEIGNPGHLELVFEVLSTDAVRILPGALVIVRNWGGEELFGARVRLIEPAAFTKVSALGVEEQRVNVIADLTAEAPSLGDAYRIDGDIVVWESSEAVQVPVSALFRNGADWNVFVVENGHALVRSVQIGERNQNNAQIAAGLNEGETVVLYPDDRLTHGQAIQPRVAK